MATSLVAMYGFFRFKRQGRGIVEILSFYLLNGWVVFESRRRVVNVLVVFLGNCFVSRQAFMKIKA